MYSLKNLKHKCQGGGFTFMAFYMHILERSPRSPRAQLKSRA